MLFRSTTFISTDVYSYVVSSLTQGSLEDGLIKQEQIIPFARLKIWLLTVV